MENEEMLEQTNEAENVDTQTTEEIEEEGIELTDTSDTEEQEPVKEKEEVRQSLKELLKSNHDYKAEFSDIDVYKRQE